MGAPLARTRGAEELASQMILFYRRRRPTAGGTETPQNSLPGHIHTLTLKAPVGVVGGIIPWNAPADQPVVDPRARRSPPAAPPSSSPPRTRR